MHWYIISLITLSFYWVIVFIIAQISEDAAFLFAVGLFYPILKVLLYPIRANRKYKNSYLYYQNHGITYWQYMFGKRVRIQTDNNPSVPKGEFRIKPDDNQNNV